MQTGRGSVVSSNFLFEHVVTDFQGTRMVLGYHTKNETVLSTITVSPTTTVPTTTTVEPICYLILDFRFSLVDFTFGRFDVTGDQATIGQGTMDNN